MRRDASYLLDILVAARKAMIFAADLTFAHFEQNCDAKIASASPPFHISSPVRANY